ncbi:Ig-like domain-containing protein, partial [Pseudoalteromonas sp. SIMBA_148]
SDNPTVAAVDENGLVTSHAEGTAIITVLLGNGQSAESVDIAALSAMEPLVGMEGFSVYYHELPDNEINDWLVDEHQKKYG